MARPLGPQDLDPLEAAAAPIPDDTLAALRADRVRRESAARRRAQEEADAQVAALESQYEAERASYDPVGRPRLGAPMPGQNGRFQFRARGDGTEAVVEADPAAAVNADFARWADEEPGSDRQRMYNPQGYAEAMAAREQERLARAAAEQEMYGVAEGPNWRENLTDEQLAAREARSEADRRQAENNKATRANVQGTDSYKKYEAKKAKLEANRVLMQQNPFLTLGDPSLTDLQREVLSRNLLGKNNRGDDPRVEVAMLEAQARSEDRRADIDSRYSLAAQERDSRRELAEMEAKAKADDRAAAVAAQAELARAEREARSEEQRLAREAEDRRWQERSASEDRKYSERSAAEQRQFEERMAAMKADNELRAKGIESQLAQFSSSNALARQKVDDEARVRAEQEKAIAKKRLEDEAVALAGPGGVHVVNKTFDTPQAQQALENLAASSDQSWTGYYNSDAVRFEALLRRLGVDDAVTRQNLVTQYGLGKPFAPGRSGPVSALFNWLSGPPNYAPDGRQP